MKLFVSIVGIAAVSFAMFYYFNNQNTQIKVLGEQIRQLKIELSVTPTITPTVLPSLSPTLTAVPTVKIVKTEIAPGTATAIIPQGKDKALIEIENKMSDLKAIIQSELKNYQEIKNTPYADIAMQNIQNLDAEYKSLEKARWQILGQM